MDTIDYSGKVPPLTPGEKPLYAPKVKEKGDPGESPREFGRRRRASAPPLAPEEPQGESPELEHRIDILV